LSSPNSATVPISQNVTVPAGSNSASFAINTNPVTTQAAVTLTASLSGTQRTATLTVQTQTVTTGGAVSGLTIFRPAPTQWLVPDVSGHINTIKFGAAPPLPAPGRAFLGRKPP